jgi:hypothetical protein
VFIPAEPQAAQNAMSMEVENLLCVCIAAACE